FKNSKKLLNDSEQTELLKKLMDGLDYLWDCADELGRDGRLTVIVSSDFSRDPYYNSGVGKAHWPIDSYMVMEKMRLALIVLLAK
ncbi:MAG: hypothetical protein P8L39_04425, partial [Halioglobus sp.]|nr:hypothetical protein [Halioglobus sp.]